MATMTVERAAEVKQKMHELAQTMTAADALAWPELFKTWAKGTTYVKDEMVMRKGTLYKCLRKHQAKAGWEPELQEKWEEVVVDE